MKPFTSDVGTLLATRNFVSADLYTFALPGGGVATLTSADHNLTWSGTTYLSGSPLTERSAISQKTGLQVSAVKITVYPRSGDTIAGVSWLDALRRFCADRPRIRFVVGSANHWHSHHAEGPSSRRNIRTLQGRNRGQ